MRAFKTVGIIIKRRNFGEADRILTVFTGAHGKIQVKATGVRKITSRRSAHIELLNYAELGLYRGKSLAVLTEAQVIEDFSGVKSDFNKVVFAYHICELIDGLCPEGQENFRVFTLLKETLMKLPVEENTAELVHGFEVELLTILGYWNAEEPYFDTHPFIEDILEKKLKSRKMFKKLD